MLFYLPNGFSDCLFTKNPYFYKSRVFMSTTVFFSKISFKKPNFKVKG